MKPFLRETFPGDQSLRLAAILALSLVACGSEPSAFDDQAEVAAEEEVVAPAAPAPAFPEDYAAMRQAADIFARDLTERDRLTLLQDASVGEGGAPPVFDLFSCVEPDLEPASLEPREAALAGLAHEAAVLEARLRAAGYRPDVWADPLRHWESDRVAEIGDGPVPAFGEPGHDALEARAEALHIRLAESLENRRATLQPEAPPIVREGGCGAGELPFLVRTEPAGGKVWLATRFSFDVCRVRGRNPWSLDECRWTEMDPDRPAWLSGNYMVQARWPDGRASRGARRMEGPDGPIDIDAPLPVIVRPG